MRLSSKLVLLTAGLLAGCGTGTVAGPSPSPDFKLKQHVDNPGQTPMATCQHVDNPGQTPMKDC